MTKAILSILVGGFIAFAALVYLYLILTILGGVVKYFRKKINNR